MFEDQEKRIGGVRTHVDVCEEHLQDVCMCAVDIRGLDAERVMGLFLTTPTENDLSDSLQQDDLQITYFQN